MHIKYISIFRVGIMVTYHIIIWILDLRVTTAPSDLEDHGELGSLLGLLQLLLSLAELGQVEGGDLLGLLDLLLVGLELHLQLAGELGHTVLVLLVLSLGEVELLGLALGPLEGLGGLASAGLGGGQLGLQLTDLALHLGHGGLAWPCAR